MKKIDSISAIILSAGYSRRMGCFKPLMPLGGQTVIEWVISLYRSAGVSDIGVVAGYRVEAVKAALAGSEARIIVNRNYQQGMYTSVLEGVGHLPSHCRAFFVHPVDIPMVRLSTVLTLLKVFDETEAKVVYPVCHGRRGHPPLMAVDLKPKILEWSGTGGLRALLEKHERAAVDVPVPDESVLFDLDTPKDHCRMLSRLKRRDRPTPGECRMLMQKICALPDRVMDHCQMVARTSEMLATAVRAAGMDIDVDLLYSAALVHDIARGRKSHAETGADLLKEWGFPKTAAMVRTHMDMEVEDNRPITEAEILYLADKLVSRDRIVDLGLRFRGKMKRYEKNPQALAAVRRRLGSAQKIRAKLEKAAGRTVDDILKNAGGVTQPDT